MQGFAAFLGKELTEILRTWRLYVVPGIMLAIGAVSPILAEITPGLLSTMAGSDLQGIVIEIPPATTVDAYLQFSNNAMQIALIALIITASGAIVGERRRGTAQLVLAKPVSRSAMVLAKVVSNCLLILLASIVSAGICVGVTAIVFDTTLIGEFVVWVALWCLLACLMVALAVALSVVFASQAGAAGAGIAVYFGMSVLSLWESLRRYTPVGLMGAGDRILTGREDVSVLWPVLSGLVVMVVLVLVASWAFEKQEL